MSREDVLLSEIEYLKNRIDLKDGMIFRLSLRLRKAEDTVKEAEEAAKTIVCSWCGEIKRFNSLQEREDNRDAMTEHIMKCPERPEAHLLKRIQRLESEMMKSEDFIQQTLGKALHFPWYKDDQANFPGSTEAEGVCVGDQVSESLASMAAKRITELEEFVNANPQ